MTKECTKSKKWYTASRDRVFKAVFVNDEYKELFECILKETLKETISITKFHITELTVKTVNERVKMLDVLIEIDKDKYILCEVNSSFSYITKERNLVFLETYSSQIIKRGNDYTKTDKIILINYNFIENLGGPILRHFTYRDEDGICYSDKRMIINVNMDKLLKNYYNGIGKEEYKHLAMLDMDKENLFKLSKTDKLAKKYYDKLMELNTNQEFVQLLSNDEEYEMYVKSEISEAREDAHKEGIKEGIDIGIKEGSKESKLEIARAMLKKNMDINLIAEITNLPVEEIKTLKQ